MRTFTKTEIFDEKFRCYAYWGAVQFGSVVFLENVPVVVYHRISLSPFPPHICCSVCTVSSKRVAKETKTSEMQYFAAAKCN